MLALLIKVILLLQDWWIFCGREQCRSEILQSNTRICPTDLFSHRKWYVCTKLFLKKKQLRGCIKWEMVNAQITEEITVSYTDSFCDMSIFSSHEWFWPNLVCMILRGRAFIVIQIGGWSPYNWAKTGKIRTSKISSPKLQWLQLNHLDIYAEK